MLQSLSNYLVLSKHPARNNNVYLHMVHFSSVFLGKILAILPICIMKKINLEVTCKRNRLGYWNSCKRLPNFVNMAALIKYHT